MKRRIRKCANYSTHWHNAPAAARRLRDWLGTRTVGLLALACVIPTIGGCSANTHLSFLNPQGPVAAAQRWHFLVVVGVLAVFVALPIFILTPWLAWRYRYRAKSARYTPKWKAFLPLEIMTWAGPMVIVAVLGFLIWNNAHALDPYKPVASNAPALQVQAIGYDWKWLFIYPQQGIASIGTMAIPVGQPVAMKLTSATVMQSLQIPALVGQIYAMGGMVTQLHLEATKPGRSMGENTMYSGKGFHQQKFTAVAMPSDEFETWVQEVRATGVPLDARTYQALSLSNTRAQLAALLPRAKSHDGNIYLKGVTAALFPAVVEATMNGTPVALDQVSMASAVTPVTAAGEGAAPSTDKAP